MWQFFLPNSPERFTDLLPPRVSPLGTPGARVINPKLLKNGVELPCRFEHPRSVRATVIAKPMVEYVTGETSTDLRDAVAHVRQHAGATPHTGTYAR